MPLRDLDGEPLRVALFLPYRLERESSVGHKSVRMLEHWQRLGAEARGFLLLRDEPWGEGFEVEPTGRGELRRQRGARRLARSLRAWGPDVVYTRFSMYIPGLRSALGSAPVVEEVNTNDRTELPLWSRKAAIYHRVTRRAAFAGRAGFVFLTPELRHDTELDRGGVRSLVLANGADLDAMRPLPAPSNQRPRAIFIAGSPSPWQGVDKVVRLARACPGVDFDIVGLGELPRPIPQNVTVHGFLTGDDLVSACGRADVGLGTLALHRKRMDEACPLKVREYLALGIPTVIGYRDPDLADLDQRWVLRIANTEDNVEESAEDIEAFARRAQGARVPRSQIEHLSWAEKESVRLSFLRSVAWP